MRKHVTLGAILLLLTITHIACTKDSDGPTTRAFTPTSGFWWSGNEPSLVEDLEEDSDEIVSFTGVLFNVSDDGSAIQDLFINCERDSGEWSPAIGPLGSLSFSDNTFSTTISGSDLELVTEELPYDINISGSFNSSEEATITVKWDTNSCTRSVNLADSCKYSVTSNEYGPVLTPLLR